MPGYLTPMEAAAALGISKATITRCVKKGAPVHRWGAAGTRYRICLSEFVEWMESQNGGGGATMAKISAAKLYNAEKLAMERRRAVQAGGKEAR